MKCIMNPNFDNETFIELERYRLKLYKWDKFIASVLPLLLLTYAAYIVHYDIRILYVGLGNCILIIISNFSISLKNFSMSKMMHFIAVFCAINVSSVLFPFIKNEYLLLPLTMLTIFSTYPFQKKLWNYAIVGLCILTSIILFVIESKQQGVYPEYKFFNTIFAFVILYIATVEIILTYLIQLKYTKIIEEDKLKLKTQNIELEKYIESNLQLENFAHIASHDLKTPLSNVIRFSQLLKSKTSNKLTEREKELFDFIISGSQHMNDSINSLFQFSQATNKKLSYTRFSFPFLIEELKKDISVNLKQSNAQLVLNSQDQLVEADRTLIKQLFLNLILNGIKFTQEHVRPIITITYTPEQKNYKFSVQDNGIGIDEKYQDSIFLIFKRLHDKTVYSGSGIGLAICKKIVESHSGKIWIESKPGNGSIFHISIPKKLQD